MDDWLPIADHLASIEILLLAMASLAGFGGVLTAMRRRNARREELALGQDASVAYPIASSRRVEALHPALGQGYLELTPEVVRFAGNQENRLGLIAYSDLDLHEATLRQVVARSFDVWFRRSRLRAAALSTRKMELARRDILGCAAFESLTTGPELLLAYRGKGAGIRWVSVFLVHSAQGHLPSATDHPEVWVRALNPSGKTALERRDAARARRRIHLRLGFAAWVNIVAFLALLYAPFLALGALDLPAAAVGGAIFLMWSVASLLTGLVVWWSYA